MTVIELADRLRTEADAYKFVEELRWPNGVAVCPHCGNEGATYIEPTNGTDRATRTGARSQRRVWRCLNCRKQFSVITGTVMHGTKVPLRVWVLCFFEMVSSKNGVAAREIERKYGVCCRTAWHLMHRIREAMKNDGLVQSMRGTVMADEMYFGGYRRGDRGRTTKAIVFTLIDRDNGEARSAVIPDVTAATLRKAIAEQADMPNTVLHTDQLPSYKSIAGEFVAHEVVNHAQDEYARWEGSRLITTNHVEGFFSQLRRSIDGTHHHVSHEHLGRYLAEFDYRYSSRKMSDTARMSKLMGQTGGKRLTYKRVKAAA